MPETIHVEFEPRVCPASEDTLARRAAAVQGLDNLDQIDAASGEVNPTEVRWFARLGGAELPLLDFTVEKLDDGRVAVSLASVVDAVTIGAPTRQAGGDAGEPPTEAERADAERFRLVTDRLDFAQRAATGSLAEQVAGNAERTQVSFTADQPGDRLLGAIRDLIRVRFNADGRKALA